MGDEVYLPRLHPIIHATEHTLTFDGSENRCAEDLMHRVVKCEHEQKLVKRLYELDADKSWLYMREHDGSAALPGGREEWEKERKQLERDMYDVMRKLRIFADFERWRTDKNCHYEHVEEAK